MTNFQREGAVSNTHVGRNFELLAKGFFSARGLPLERGVSFPVGISKKKKSHAFDLGSKKRKVIVECKSHRWTKSGYVPSAKMTVWNEAMYYFRAAPGDLRKILFVLRDFSIKRGETLAQYYIRIYEHLIPTGTEIWEYDAKTRKAKQLR